MLCERSFAVITALLIVLLSSNIQVLANANMPTDWVKAASNPEFAFRNIEIDHQRVLQLKSLHSGNVYDLYKSALVESFSKAIDISPDGRTIVFGVTSKVTDGFIDQTHVVAFNHQNNLSLSDGITHQTNQGRKLIAIRFHQNQFVDLSYADGKSKSTETIDLKNNFRTINKKNSDAKDIIVNFYGGALAPGAKLQKTKNSNEYEISFNASNIAGAVKKHIIQYDPSIKAIVSLDEMNINNQKIRSTKFSYNGFNYLTEIYNTDGELIYCKASADKANADVISNYLYLKAELDVFYSNRLPTNSKVTIKNNVITIDLGAHEAMPIQRLRFAYSLDRYSDYGFSSFEERTYDNSKKYNYVFSNHDGIPKFYKTHESTKLAYVSDTTTISHN